MFKKILLCLVFISLVCSPVYGMTLNAYNVQTDAEEFCMDGYKFVVFTTYNSLFGRVVSDSTILMEVKQVYGNVYNKRGHILKENVPIRCND